MKALAALQESSKWCTWSNERDLPHHLVEGRWAHPGGEGLRGGETTKERCLLFHLTDHRTLLAALGYA